MAEQFVSDAGSVDVMIMPAGKTNISEPGSLDLEERANESVYVELRGPNRASGLVRADRTRSALEPLRRSVTGKLRSYGGLQHGDHHDNWAGRDHCSARIRRPMRGEYAAITAWFGIACIVGQMGLPAALCFYVSKDPQRARDYVATSRAMMIATGLVAFIGGLLLAPVLSRGNPVVIDGYRIAFATSVVTFVGVAYTYALQARHLLQWNLVRAIQPVLSLFALCVLWFLKLLTLETALFILAVTLALQLGWGYWYCRRNSLAPGRARVSLFAPLAAYGIAQIAALTPATLNAQLDQSCFRRPLQPLTLADTRSPCRLRCCRCRSSRPSATSHSPDWRPSML